MHQTISSPPLVPPERPQASRILVYQAVDNLPIELEDIGSLKKVRVTIDARGARKEWFLNCIELTNMMSKKQYLFVCEEWLSRNQDRLTLDVPLFKAGQETIPKTDYKITG